MLVHSFPSRSPLPEPHVSRSTDGVALRPMSLEEAVKEAAFRDRDVFVFRDHERAGDGAAPQTRREDGIDRSAVGNGKREEGRAGKSKNDGKASAD